MSDYGQHKGTLPYASELFGVYQPLLGWKSRLMTIRVDLACLEVAKSYVLRMLTDPHELHIKKPIPQPPSTMLVSNGWMRSRVGSYVSGEVSAILASKGRLPDGEEWDAILKTDTLERLIRTVDTAAEPRPDVTRVPSLGLEVYRRATLSEADLASGRLHSIEGTDLMIGLTATADVAAASAREAAVAAASAREAVVAGALQWFSKRAPAALKALFGPKPPSWEAARYFADPLATFDPETQLAVLSPIGIVHLYREYFFELDTFLGPPVGHVWLSPGGTVELYEVNTRRTVMERTTEQLTETTSRSELTTTEHDEISDAVKEDNQRNIKFGSSASAGVNFGVFQARASADFNYENTSKQAAEATHKHMREQSEKTSSEIRRNFKTTFRTETEISDTSSRRYVVQNTTNKLVNYELRRKMRKVMVQVQHIGTQMCWQVYVDEPGRDLGLAELVHVASPEDLASAPKPPDGPPEVKPKTTTLTKDFHYEADGTHNDMTDNFVNGASDDAKIVWYREYEVTPPVGYELAEVTGVAVDHPQNDVSARFIRKSEQSFEIRLDFVNFHDKHFIRFELTLKWTPSDTVVAAANAAFKASWEDYKEAESRRAKEEYVKSVRERIKAAGNVPLRPSSELREEERTLIYRKLIAQLMQVATGQESHVTAELIRSLFDVDKMLYFVAPEWWLPRARWGQQVAPTGATPSGDPLVITDDDRIGWGGASAQGRPSNYLVTEDAQPARLGSSIGWLLQLDADNHRNAFLNSPWVKAVIPIQPGREMAALKWLREVPEGSNNLDAHYAGSVNPAYLPEGQAPEQLTIEQALAALAAEVSAHGTKVDNTLKTETVFEKGLDPLAMGFRATGTPCEVFDQWVEVLPTDQLAAVEVEYDPKTLQIKLPAPPS